MVKILMSIAMDLSFVSSLSHIPGMGLILSEHPLYIKRNINT